MDSLGIGQFSNIQQNAALCSAIISKVHNGAVAVGRCEPRLTHAVSHPLFFWWEEVDSFNSGTGKFTCISGASAPKRWFRRNAPRGVNRAESTIPGIKKDTALRCLFFGGKRWIRTTEGGANRFTVCSLWPLGNLPTLGAGGRSRTNNLLITNQLLCH